MAVLSAGSRDRGDEEQPRCPHAAEIPALFRKPCALSRQVQELLRTCFYRFAKTGDPNAPGEDFRQQSDGAGAAVVISCRPRMFPDIRPKDTALLLPLMKEHWNGGCHG